MTRPAPARGRRTTARWLAAILALAVVACDAGDSTPRLPALPEGAVVLAFGDSLTFGTGTTAEHAYPTVLARLIDRYVVRSGVPGEVSAAGMRRLPGDLQRHRPNLVILLHGGNDILRRVSRDTTEANLRAMVAKARGAGAAVVLVGVPEPGLFMSDGAPFYKRIADELDLPYLSGTIAQILKTDTLISDPLHPNAAGYRRLAEEIAALLRRAGAV